MVGIATNSIHAADDLVRVSDVAPPIGVSTTFRYDNNPKKLVKYADRNPEEGFLGTPVYSRLTHPNSEQAEEAIGAITDSLAICYSSGLASIFAAFTHFHPKIVAIGHGYHGTHGIADIFTRISGLKQISIKDDLSQLGKGDVIYLETPVNPDGEIFDIEYYADKAHSVGAILIVDSTFAPPPLSNPFNHGADLVLHSATKFFGGHSDLLAGVLLTQDPKVKLALLYDRICLGSNIANLESYLLVRSLRTYELRILKQSENATKLVEFLESNRDRYPKIASVTHGSVQEKKDAYIKKQHPGGHSPVFAFELETEDLAREFPSLLRYFYHATSLGGVESLIEWRAMSEDQCSPKLLRVSVGVENIDDLIADFTRALDIIHSELTI